MSPKITLSIIIPTYNNPQEINSLCCSISNQTTDEIEVLVIDDGSEVPVKKIVEKFNFKYFYKKNTGPASSRNHGATLAEGQYLLFLDSDTVMPDNMLRKILSTIKKENIAICSIFYSEKSHNPGIGQQFKAYFDYFHNCHKIQEGKTKSLQGSSCFFKKIAFEELGGWNKNFEGATIENEEFANRIQKNGKYQIIFKPELRMYHNFQNLNGLLKTIFKRSIIWTQLKITGTVNYDGLVRTKLKGFVAIQSLLLIVLSFTVFKLVGQLLFMFSLIVYLLGNFKFYFFLLERCGLFNTVKYIFAQYLFHLSVSAGAVIGLLSVKTHKFKY